MRRLLIAVTFAFASPSLAACNGEEDKPRVAASATSAPETQRWAFVDAFAALKSPDPDKRLLGVNWIGAHLATHAGLAKEALRAAASDDDTHVAARAKTLLRQLGER